jgi:hypothetical protein
MIDKIANWFRLVLAAVIKRKSVIVITGGVIDNMRSQRITTGYHRLFTVRWCEVYGKDIQHHEIAVSAFNEAARMVKGDGYVDGDVIDMIGALKTHNETYVELIDIKRNVECTE